MNSIFTFYTVICIPYFSFKGKDFRFSLSRKRDQKLTLWSNKLKWDVIEHFAKASML
ncbi:hypothetical protein [Nonlabens dokdonensis]|uniref:Uncharacterized protein n=1 Tax=Nonlabens dokdonensis (strain DSM 17205 / KCTC 12402 / DSW-6) TaxID=592029 RepID=L7WCG4_NONDD|nr:hypothetical protein [Nonlabens dokdonensis]AGC77907.1 hypothetical protein DDD_2780 [Nonlabens dokdonensis DSW-6]